MDIEKAIEGALIANAGRELTWAQQAARLRQEVRTAGIEVVPLTEVGCCEQCGGGCSRGEVRDPSR